MTGLPRDLTPAEKELFAQPSGEKLSPEHLKTLNDMRAQQGLPPLAWAIPGPSNA